MPDKDLERVTESAILTFNDVLIDTNRAKLPLTFRKVVDLPEAFIRQIEFNYEVREPQARKLRKQDLNPTIYHDLPPTMNFEIGDYIGSGRTGCVFEVKPLDSPDVSLPQLVAKFGRQGFNKFMLRETWFYEEMQSLQGIAIPWCYGLYVARVPRGSAAFVPWLRQYLEHSHWWGDSSMPEVYLNQNDNFTKFLEKCARGRSVEDIECDENAIEFLGNFKEEYSELVKPFDNTSSHLESRDIIVPVLILEKVGKPYLPIGEPISEDMNKEVYDVYDRLSELGITHMDVKYENILAAPPPILSSPREVAQDEKVQLSDLTVPRRSHKCRLVDFELSRTTNQNRDRMNFGYQAYLERLLLNLPKGRVINQHSDE